MWTTSNGWDQEHQFSVLIFEDIIKIKYFWSYIKIKSNNYIMPNDQIIIIWDGKLKVRVERTDTHAD